ncbi:MAG: nuclear transport factor 2 family protein [Novosphingobium sp.]
MAFTGPLEDRIAINDLVVTYGDAVTRRDGAAWGALWAEDGIWSLPGIPGMDRIEGRKAIVAAWTEGMKDFPFQVNRQNLSNLTVTGDTAAGDTYTAELVKDKEGKAAHWTNRYVDRFVKVDGTWLFAQRTLEILHIGSA